MRRAFTSLNRFSRSAISSRSVCDCGESTVSVIEATCSSCHTLGGLVVAITNPPQSSKRDTVRNLEGGASGDFAQSKSRPRIASHSHGWSDTLELSWPGGYANTASLYVGLWGELCDDACPEGSGLSVSEIACRSASWITNISALWSQRSECSHPSPAKCTFLNTMSLQLMTLCISPRRSDTREVSFMLASVLLVHVHIFSI